MILQKVLLATLLIIIGVVCGCEIDKTEEKRKPTVEAVSIEDTGELQEAQARYARYAQKDPPQYEDGEDDLLAVESQVAEARDSGIDVDSYSAPGLLKK